MLKKIKSAPLSLFLGFVLFINAYAVNNLAPQPEHAIVSKVVAKLLTRYHYTHRIIDDAISSETLDFYLNALDRRRMYFLASDIDQFDAYRYSLDDAVIRGDLEPAYFIFNTLMQRVRERVNYVKELLSHEFDFTKDDYYNYDREEAPWAKTTDELNELWRLRIKHEALSLKLAGKDWNGIVKTLTKRYNNLLKRYEQLNSEDVFQYFMNALAECYDPHTSYMSPITSENFGIEMSLSLEGIGAQLITEDDYTKVVRIIPGGPADRSKQLWPNDRIVGVAQGRDGEMVDVIGMRLDDVVQMIRGKKGTVVRLEVLPAGHPPGSPTKIISLVRDRVVIREREAKSDTVEIIHEGKKYTLGIIKVPTFYADFAAQQRGDKDYVSTTRDVRRLIKQLKGANIDGLLIDLRGNGGGSLQEAIELTGLFIKDGPVVQVRNSYGDVKVEEDPDPHLVYDGPMAVIVDRYSASASEIFAAAIQDYGRGVILGSRSFGKGTVQHLLPLGRFIRSDHKKLGQLKITVAKFYRIDGSTTQNRGVIPDIIFPSVLDEMDFGESSYKTALPWDKIQPANFDPVDSVTKFLFTLRKKSKKRISQSREFKYLLEDIENFKKKNKEKRISLKESVRKKEREEEDQKKLARINARRKAKGLPPYASLKDVPDNEESPDIILDESMHVLSDLIALTSKGTAKAEH